MCLRLIKRVVWALEGGLWYVSKCFVVVLTGIIGALRRWGTWVQEGYEARTARSRAIYGTFLRKSSCSIAVCAYPCTDDRCEGRQCCLLRSGWKWHWKKTARDSGIGYGVWVHNVQHSVAEAAGGLEASLVRIFWGDDKQWSAPTNRIFRVRLWRCQIRSMISWACRTLVSLWNLYPRWGIGSTRAPALLCPDVPNVLWTGSWWGRRNCEGKRLVEGEMAQSETATIFEVGAKSLHCLLAPRVYYSDTQIHYLQRPSVSDCTIHFWWKNLPVGAILGHVGYIDVRDVANAHPWFTNIVFSVPKISVDEFVYKKDLT